MTNRTSNDPQACWEDGGYAAVAEVTATAVTEQVTEWAMFRGADGSEATFCRHSVRTVGNPVARMLTVGRARRATLPAGPDGRTAGLAELVGSWINWPRAHAELPAGDAAQYRGCR